jgi:hypothetical protein
MHAETGGEEFEKILDEETQDLLEIWGDWAGDNQ